ncbi:MAG TPA: rod shape-determining protein MreD [Actinomycetes bacterium]|jgi:rod shape-determining protein MreD|nr:rod shape-determining protein MreD [Actinomycetes bacterium]
MRRALVLAAVIAAGVVLESTLLTHLRLGGARPDVLVLAVIAVAMACGPVTGSGFGFAAGLVSDLEFAAPVGVSALVYTVIGFGTGAARMYVTSSRTWVHLLLAAAASLASVWLSGVVLRVFDLSSWVFLVRTGPWIALYNLLLTPFVYPLVRTLAARAGPGATDSW